jgi:hypothetical protein
MDCRFVGINRGVLLVVAVVCLAALATPAFAQDASIIGQVADEGGGVLPGVTVTATSPALQVPQVTDVTNELGEYRLTALPLGTYVVQYELAGFGTLRREDIRLTAGFTARVDIRLKVGTLTETVTVSGAAPIVDVASTSTSTQLTKETLELIPTGRAGLQSMMVQAPGVRTNLDIGQPTANPLFRAFGQNGDSWQTLDGVVTTSPKGGNQSGNWFDSQVFEEASITSVANPAEAPSRGIQVSIVIKSGGNDFHGSGSLIQSGKKFQGDNVDDKLRAQGITAGNPVAVRWDRSAELGGRIVRNKLWFYVQARERRDDSYSLGGFNPDGAQAISKQVQRFATVKLSNQISPSTKIVGFYQHLGQTGDGAATQFAAYESRQVTYVPVHTGKVEWQMARGNKFMSFQYGFWNWYYRRNGASDNVATSDQLTGIITGMNVVAATRQHEGRKGIKGTLNWYKPGLLWGNHDFKIGFDNTPGAHADRSTVDRGAAGNYILIFRNGVPFQFDAKSNPTNPSSPVNYFGTYLQDNWTIARRLSLNLGVRYAHDNGFLPEQCRVASRAPLDIVFPAQCYPFTQFNVWNPVSPRFHVSYDVTGDGKTLIKGGWGMYVHQRGIDELQMGNALADSVVTYTWHDNNGNKVFDPGEVNFDPNGPDFVARRVEVGQALSGAVPNPNEKEPMTDEFSMSFERELIPNFAVRATGIYSREHNAYRVQNNKRPYNVYNIPVTARDPGPDGRLGTSDDPGTTVTYWEYPVAYQGAAFQEPMLINDKGSNGNYRSFEVAASKRLSNRWMFMGSYSATKVHVPFVSNTAGLTDFTGGGGLTVILATFDPNAEIFATNNTWEWISRMSGAYIFPGDVSLSANFEQRSGDPWARQVSVTGGRTIPQNRQRVEPIGSRRLDTINILNLRGEKGFRLGGGRRIALQVNVYNALNINTATAVTPLSGPNFNIPSAITRPRLAEVGLTYTF